VVENHVGILPQITQETQPRNAELGGRNCAGILHQQELTPPNRQELPPKNAEIYNKNAEKGVETQSNELKRIKILLVQSLSIIMIFFFKSLVVHLWIAVPKKNLSTEPI
jgi:hypothetical protein